MRPNPPINGIVCYCGNSDNGQSIGPVLSRTCCYFSCTLSSHGGVWRLQHEGPRHESPDDERGETDDRSGTRGHGDGARNQHHYRREGQLHECLGGVRRCFTRVTSAAAQGAAAMACTVVVQGATAARGPSLASRVAEPRRAERAVDELPDIFLFFDSIIKGG